MDAVLAGVPAVPLHLAVEIWDREGLCEFHVTIALDPPDDVVGRGIKVWPAAMAVEFKFLAMRGHHRHNGFRCRLPYSSVEAARMQRTITPEYSAKVAIKGGVLP